MLHQYLLVGLVFNFHSACAVQTLHFAMAAQVMEREGLDAPPHSPRQKEQLKSWAKRVESTSF